MKIDKQELKKFRNDFESAVKNLEKKYSVKIDLGNITYTDDSFTSFLKVINSDKIDSSETAKEIAWRKEWEKTAPLFNLDKNIPKNPIGKIAIINGKSYIFKGINSSSKKYPYVFENIKKPGYASGFDYDTFINVEWL